MVYENLLFSVIDRDLESLEVASQRAMKLTPLRANIIELVLVVSLLQLIEFLISRVSTNDHC